MKTVHKIRLNKQPPGWNKVAKLLAFNGANLFALFGGAIRDTDLGKPVNDYDVRVWMDSGEAQAFLSALRCRVQVNEVPSVGTGKIRYCFSYAGFNVDLSIRPIPRSWVGLHIPIDAVAIERAGDSDAGLCSVALDPVGRAFATEEYEVDRTDKTITIYNDSQNPERVHAYAERMQNKFQDYQVVWKG